MHHCPKDPPFTTVGNASQQTVENPLPAPKLMHCLRLRAYAEAPHFLFPTLVSFLPMFSIEDYRIGWLCDKPTTFIAALTALDQKHPNLPVRPSDYNHYTLGSLSGHNVVLTCVPNGDSGLVQASIVAAQMMHSFGSIRFVLSLGLAGGGSSQRGHSSRRHRGQPPHWIPWRCHPVRHGQVSWRWLPANRLAEQASASDSDGHLQTASDSYDARNPDISPSFQDGICEPSSCNRRRVPRYRGGPTIRSLIHSRRRHALQPRL